MLASFIVITGLSATSAQTGAAAVGLAVIPTLFIFFAGYDIAITPFLTAYLCEIWSFTQRSRGLTVTWCSSVVALFLNTFANPLAPEAIQWRYYIVYIAMLALFAVTVYFAYPETRGFSLEQMAVIFDGDDADVILTAETREETVIPAISGEKDAWIK
ncbi:sugar transporter [Colletotrichum tabaci]|uniref:Sugar transporter n=1 Tax=Colletotrichum tabaci TaxID=1209068 RepID=A0AAV9SYT1_9PEZI